MIRARTFGCALVLLVTTACREKPANSGNHPLPVPAAPSALRAPRLAFDLASDLANKVGPRVAGSEGDRAAVQWALAAFASRGIEAHAEPVRARVWRRIAESAELVAPSARRLTVTALGWSAPSLPGGVEAEVVEVASLAEAQKLAPGALAGKIVLYNGTTERAKDGSGYGRAVGARGLGARVAERAGAVASLVRSVGTDTSDDTPHTGSQRQDSANIPSLAISHPSADALHALIEAGKHPRVKLMVDCEDLGYGDSANVVATVRGADRPEEIVLMGAHLDSWDLARGALDDGAGVGTVMAALTELSGTAISRSVRVVLFSAEETSLAGGKAYAVAHESEIARHVLGVEIDTGTSAAYETRISVGPGLRDTHARALADLMGPLGAPFADGEGDGGADLSPLRAAGMPVLELRQDMTTYFDIHHSKKDTADKLDAVALDQLVTQLASAVSYAANTTAPFGRAVRVR